MMVRWLVKVTTVCALSSVLVSPSDAQTVWTKYSGNPVLLGSVHHYAASVLKEGDIYKMWYTVHRNRFDIDIDYATSPDGIHWTRYINNPVLEVTAPWACGRVAYPVVIKDEALYKMWFLALACENDRSIGYATSTDGVSWSVYGPVFTGGSTGEWDEKHLGRFSIIKDGGTFKLWYSIYGEEIEQPGLGYATSPDGINWTKFSGNPVMEGTPGSWDENSYIMPWVIKTGSTYEMWYSGHIQGGSKIGYAWSEDGIHWMKYLDNPILTPGPDYWDSVDLRSPAVVRDGNLYMMWYTGYRSDRASIGLATAEVEVIDIAIDIKPGSDPNSINLNSRGVVPVAILTTDDFDANRVDTLIDLLFAGAPPNRCSFEDVDNDGDEDLICHFRTQELTELDENSTEATLTGQTTDEPPIPIIGTDSVNIVPEGK